MGRGRPCICPLCGMTVKKEEAFEYKKKYYHDDCFSSMSRQTTKIEQSKQKQKVRKVKENIQKETHTQIETDISDEELLAKDKVLNYLRKLLNTKNLGAKTYKLLKDYFIYNKFSYEGMLIALKYFYEIQGNPITLDCVGIIPYIYDEAQDHERSKNIVVEQIDKLDMKNIITYKVIKIKKQDKIGSKLIDISGLEE